MTNAYCTLEDVKSSLSGDVPNMGSSHDQSLVNKIMEVSRDVDRKVSECRMGSDELFSFLADQLYGRQVVYLSSTPAPTTGSFVLAYAGQITSDISFDADGATVQAALEALSTVGAGNVSVFGFAGGPWTVDFAGDLTGPRPSMTGRATTDQADASIVVLPAIQGVSVVPSARQFRSTPELYGEILPIDDCVEVVEVRTISLGVTSRIWTPGVDYLPLPSRGTPIEALKCLVDPWPEWPDVVEVEARWGYRAEVPTDVRETTTIEVIRSHFSGLVGNDDRLGMTPFGSVITSKAFTSKFRELTQEYGRKLW